MRYDDILQTIGRTPAVRLTQLAPPHVAVYAKLEAFNPMGSVKDRMALAVIEAAERSGDLPPGGTVVEATSGNAGIGLALVCARKGYPLVIVMAENFSVERRRLMRYLGAKVVLTPAALKASGMLAKARELARAHGWYWPRQFDNPANAEMHARTTAQEILQDFADAPLSHWVTGSGTGGTLLGVARALRRHAPATRVVVCEPDNAPVLARRRPAPPNGADGLAAVHPDFRPHPMQGWTPDFVPGLVQQALDEDLVHRIQPVSGADALATARALARHEGIFCGISGGATVAGALALAATLPAGSRVLAMVPDTGERYLSTPLFDGIAESMDDEEHAISRSTPSASFGLAAVPVATPAPASATPPAMADVQARAEIDALASDPAHPVLMFGLQWCEFCWAVRRLFEALGVPLHTIDLDAPTLQAGDHGNRLRAALAQRTGAHTLPQVVIGGRWIGGCVDTLQAWDDGDLRAWLTGAGQAPDPAIGLKAVSLLPRWVHPR